MKRWTKNECLDLHKAIDIAKRRLDEVQSELGRVGLDPRLTAEEKLLMSEYKILKQRESMELQQRMEEEWLLFGDKYSKLFHKLLRAKANRTSICEITDESGVT